MPPAPSQRQVRGPPVGLPGVRAVRPLAPPAPGDEALPGHGLAHLPLGERHRLAAVGARRRAGPHAPVAVGPPRAGEGARDPQVDGRRAPLIPLARPKRVEVGALRDLQGSQHFCEGPPSLPTQSLSALGLPPVRETRRVACFWVADHRPRHVQPRLELRYDRVLLRALALEPRPRRPVRHASPFRRVHVTASAGSAHPSRDDRGRADPEPPGDVAVRHPRAAQPDGLGLRRRRVAGVPLVVDAARHAPLGHLELAALRRGPPAPHRHPGRPAGKVRERLLRHAALEEVGEDPLLLLFRVHCLRSLLRSLETVRKNAALPKCIKQHEELTTSPIKTSEMPQRKV